MIHVCSKENPGSRWPKVTLGAVKDGFRLTPEQFQELRKLCKEESECFTGEPCDVHIRYDAIF